MHDKHRVCTVHYRRIHANPGLAALNALVAGLRHPSILGGSAAKAGADGFSYWAAAPRDVFQFYPGDKEPLAKLERVLASYTLAGADQRGTNDTRCVPRHDVAGGDRPYGMPCGGWIGYFAYELGRYIEPLPETAVDDLDMPLIRLCFYDQLIAYDHRSGSFWAIVLELPDDTLGPHEKLAELAHLCELAQGIHVTEPGAADIDCIDRSRFTCNMDRDDYRQAVRRIRRYIFDGDVYQVNFSQRFESDFFGRPVELFHWQNRYNPSGYSAYIDAGDFQIVSASPEMFVTQSNGRILTKPIKGTRPRVEPRHPRDAQLNAARFEELLTSEKEQAELNMIVDLERNDLAKICIPGTRRVLQPRTIECYPTVFHAAATVGGQIRPGTSFTDVLRAMFPGGSITGAPKIRAMQIIDELEPTARGVYTGCIGFIGLDGTACLNIAIRTIILTGHKAFVQSGGGIVADSDPQAEWDETMVKARALLAAIRAVQQARAAPPAKARCTKVNDDGS